MFYLGNMHLVENGNLKLAESIFSLSRSCFSKSCFSVSTSLPYATKCNSLFDNVSYHLSIFLILLMNFFLWFPEFYVVSLFLTKCTFHLNHLCLVLFFVFQQNLIMILCECSQIRFFYFL